MATITIRLSGASDLLLHSDRGCNPLSDVAIAHKALTSKRKKTDEDHLAIARSEYMMGFYDSPGVSIPGQNVKSALVQGFKFNKLGMAAKRCVMVVDEWLQVAHAGPNDPDKLWNGGKGPFVDCRSVKVSTARLMRYRPRLRDWRITAAIMFDDRMIEKAQLIVAAENAGQYVGIGDYRPETGGGFGRFTVEVVK